MFFYALWWSFCMELDTLRTVSHRPQRVKPSGTEKRVATRDHAFFFGTNGVRKKCIVVERVEPAETNVFGCKNGIVGASLSVARHCRRNIIENSDAFAYFSIQKKKKR
jgi:hypothetical protein